MSGISRTQQDQLINAGRRAGKYTLSSAEGRVSPAEMAAWIEEYGDRLLYISRRLS